MHVSIKSTLATIMAIVLLTLGLSSSVTASATQITCIAYSPAQTLLCPPAQPDSFSPWGDPAEETNCTVNGHVNNQPQDMRVSDICYTRPMNVWMDQSNSFWLYQHSEVRSNASNSYWLPIERTNAGYVITIDVNDCTTKYYPQASPSHTNPSGSWMKIADVRTTGIPKFNCRSDSTCRYVLKRTHVVLECVPYHESQRA